MVQIIQDRGLSELLGQALGGGLVGGLQGYQEGRQMKEERLAQEREQADKMKRNQQFAELLSGKPLSSALAGLQEPGMVQAQVPHRAPLSRDEMLQAAYSAGLSPQDISNLEKAYSSREKNDIARETLKVRQEGPERRILAEESQRIAKGLENSNRKINDFKALIKLSESGDLRSGKFRQGLDKVGLGDFWQNPTSDVAEKLIGDINIASMLDLSETGQITDQKLKQIAKTNPSLMMTPQGLKSTAQIRILGEQAQKQVGEELKKIRKENPGKVLPIDAIEIARERAEPKIEQIHAKQLALVDKIANQKPSDKEASKSFSSLPSAYNYSGKVFMNEAGERVRSNGVKWEKI